MIETAIKKPVAVTVGVLLVILFGSIGLFRVPVQLTPDLAKPQITIETLWPGASPFEIESEIVSEQEEQLRGVEGLERMTSQSFDNQGRITLEFPPGTDLDSALIRVSNRLEQVPEYPADAEKPVILMTNKTDNAMAWFMLRLLPGNSREIDTYFRFADDVIRPRFERIPGVGASNVLGGREEELQVEVDPEALAARGLTVGGLLAVIDRENTNLSAGDFSEGKRKYKVRTVAEYETPADVESIVIGREDGRRIYLRDVAKVGLGYKKRLDFVRQAGVPTLAINCIRKNGANVIETMEEIRAAVRELNEGLLASERLELRQVYDETDYITAAIDNVLRNLLIGSGLAVVILFLFLRSLASTGIIAIAIPISVIGSFVLLYLFGRTVNVVSLAGMSFASGMVVDNAIVSLESIYRFRQEGRSPFAAALEGTRVVWGAILASTLTTIAVFVPLLFVEERAAQLFRDIAIAISCSVGLSLLVSVTVIPTLGARILGRVRPPTVEGARRGWFDRVRGGVLSLVGLATRSVPMQLAVVLVLTVVSLTLAWFLRPDAEYLPTGNRNLAIAVLLPPPGYSVAELERLALDVEDRLLPFVRKEESTAASVGIPRAEAASEGAGAASGSGLDPVAIRHFFFVAREASVFLGAAAEVDERAAELIPVLQEAVADLPGMISIVQQASLFERGASTGRSVDIEITGPRLERLVEIGGMIFGRVMELFPRTEGHQARPVPSLDLQTPEIRVEPDRALASDVGLDAREVGVAVNVLVDGAKASEYRHLGREVDLTVVGRGVDASWRTQDIANIPIATPRNGTVLLSSIARIELARGPQEIQRIERDRAIIIRVVPANHVPLEAVVETVRRDVVQPLLDSGVVERPYAIRLAGTVDDLARAFVAFRWNFVLAIVITYLLLAALFESFLYPLVVLFSVPLAAVGGVLCLVLVRVFVPGVQLDVLTMLGFVILVGIVVNNAILIVYGALGELRAGADVSSALVSGVRDRVRPIFMTTLTSGFGMLPLILFPGAGSELYRGLGSVVVGGLVVSTIFTLFLVPALLGLVFTTVSALRRRTT